MCDINGVCDINAADIMKPPSRSEILTLQNQLQELKEDIEKLKTKPTPKILTPEEKIWEDRRRECNDNVIRNIDYQHVPSLTMEISSLIVGGRT